MCFVPHHQAYGSSTPGGTPGGTPTRSRTVSPSADDTKLSVRFRERRGSYGTDTDATTGGFTSAHLDRDTSPGGRLRQRTGALYRPRSSRYQSPFVALLVPLLLVVMVVGNRHDSVWLLWHAGMLPNPLHWFTLLKPAACRRGDRLSTPPRRSIRK